MALNPDKSNAGIFFDTQKRAGSYSALESVDFAHTNINLSDHIKILGTTLDWPVDRHIYSYLEILLLGIIYGPCATSSSLPSLINLLSWWLKLLLHTRYLVF